MLGFTWDANTGLLGGSPVCDRLLNPDLYPTQHFCSWEFMSPSIICWSQWNWCRQLHVTFTWSLFTSSPDAKVNTFCVWMCCVMWLWWNTDNWRAQMTTSYTTLYMCLKVCVSEEPPLQWQTAENLVPRGGGLPLHPLLLWRVISQ